MNSEPVTDFNPTLFRQHRDNRHVMNRVTGQENQFPVNTGGYRAPLMITEMLHRQRRVLRHILEPTQRVDDGQEPVAGSVVILLQNFLALPLLIVEWPGESPVNGFQKGRVMVDDMAHMLADDVLFLCSERLPVQRPWQHNQQVGKLVDGVGIFGNEFATVT